MAIIPALVPLVVILALVMLATRGGGPFRQLAVSAELHGSASAASVRVQARNFVALGSAAIVAAVLVAIGLSGAVSLSPLVPVAPALAATTAIAVFAVMPGTRLREPAGIRAADLVPRAPLSFGSRWLFVAASTSAALTIVVLIALGLSGNSDGRSVTVTTEFVVSTAGPYPGFFYGVPIIAALVLLAAVTTVAVFRIPAAARPTDESLRGVDAAIRLISMRIVLKAAIAAALFTLGVVLISAGASTHSAADTVMGDSVLRPAIPELIALSQVEAVAGWLLLATGLAFLLWAVRDAVRRPVGIETVAA